MTPWGGGQIPQATESILSRKQGGDPQNRQEQGFLQACS